MTRQDDDKQIDRRLTDGILNSNLYRSLAAGRTDVELWQENQVVDGWVVFWIATFQGGHATFLAELRAKDGQMQHRARDEQGVETWVDLE
jgi:hypothetical protein